MCDIAAFFKPATVHAIMGMLVELESWEDNAAYNPVTVCDSEMFSGGYLDDLKDLVVEDLIDGLER